MGMVKSTTVIGIRRDGSAALASDGQVTVGNTIMKAGAHKVSRLHGGSVLAGFAGSVADSLTLFDLFERKLEEYHGGLTRAAVEMAKEWRTDKVLHRLEALLLVADQTNLLIVSGAGEVIEPDDGVAAIGSGGPIALGVARALLRHTSMSPGEIAREAIGKSRARSVSSQTTISPWRSCRERRLGMTPRGIVTELDRFIVGQQQAKRAIAIAIRNRERRRLLPEDIREEILPKNILMIGPTGVGKTEMARRLAKLVSAPFIKIEATKFTEVGYVGRDVDSMVRDLIEAAIRMVKARRHGEVKEKAAQVAEERLIDLLLGLSEQPYTKEPRFPS